MNNQTDSSRQPVYPVFSLSPTESGAKEYAKKKSGGLLLAFSFLISFIFLRLALHGGGLGYSVPVITVLSWGMFLPLVISRDKKFSWSGVFSLLPILILALCCGIFSGGGMVKFITLTAMLVLTLLQNVKTSGISAEGFFSLHSFKLALRTVFLSPFEVMGSAFSSLKAKKKGGKGVIGKILIGVLISLPAVVFLICYFSLTDAVFGYYVKNFIDFFNLNIFTLILDLFGAAIITLYLFPYNFVLCAGTTVEINEKEKKNRGIDGVYIASFLGSCMLVYLAFVAVQFGYLFNASLPADLENTISYSDYARKGFFELCFITFLTFLVIVIAMCVTKKNSKGRMPVYVKVVLAVLALSDIIFVASALMRDWLYISEYGMTRARVIGVWFAVLLAICTVGVIIKIFFEKSRLTFLFASIAVIMVIALNAVNIDAVIARYNVDRYYNTDKIDMYYIDELSLSAGDEILRIADKDGGIHYEKTYNILAEKCYGFEENRKFGSWTLAEVNSYNKLMKNPKVSAKVADMRKHPEKYYGYSEEF